MFFVSFSGAFSLSDDTEFAAIKSIHNQLDDNADGSVDFRESEEVSSVLTLFGLHKGYLYCVCVVIGMVTSIWNGSVVLA